MKKKKKGCRTKSEQIHYTMSQVRSKDTKIEVRLRKALWNNGIRYRKNFKELPGTPDIAITKYKIAIFCDGEFWHGKDLNSQKKYLHTNRDFWISKIKRNIDHDCKIDLQLEHKGWYVLRFWGKEIEKNLDICVNEIKELIIQVQIDSCNIYDFYTDEKIDEMIERAVAEQSPEYGPHPENPRIPPRKN